MKKIFSVITFFLFLIIFSSPFLRTANAADIRTDNIITISKNEKGLSDLYLFGNSITVEAPVNNDLVAAGRDVIIETQVNGDILAAGGTMRIRGGSGGSVRVAGGNVVIDGNISRDLVVGGGTVTITKPATVAGDLIIGGGDIVIQGKINGKVVMSGGNVRLEGIIGKQVEGNANQLFIGPTAVIGGNLNYSSPEKAKIERGAVIRGTQHFTRITQPKNEPKQFWAVFGAFSFYKLIVDILISLALIFFLNKFIQTSADRIKSEPFKDFIWGFAFLFLMPLFSLFLLIFVLPGIVAFLFYFLILIFAVYLAKVFTGWLIVRWWYSRGGSKYVLDWKSGIAGPLAFFVIALIPIFGWLFAAILFVIAIGALLQELALIFRTQRTGTVTRK